MSKARNQLNIIIPNLFETKYDIIKHIFCNKGANLMI